MTVDWASLSLRRIEQAREAMRDAVLLVQGNRNRAAVNRAYYAMFYGAVAALNRLGLSPRRHATAVNMALDYLVKPGHLPRVCHTHFAEAFHRRQRWDYEATPPPSTQQAQEVLKWAQEFVSDVEAVLPSLAPPGP